MAITICHNNHNLVWNLNYLQSIFVKYQNSCHIQIQRQHSILIVKIISFVYTVCNQDDLRFELIQYRVICRVEYKLWSICIGDKSVRRRPWPGYKSLVVTLYVIGASANSKSFEQGRHLLWRFISHWHSIIIHH